MILATHAQRLERWLGADSVEHLSRSMRDWYGPPIAIGGVPGAVWAHRGGDFRGRIASGELSSAIDFAEQRARRILRNVARCQMSTLNMAGFSSLSDLISEATVNGKRYTYQFSKVGPAGVAGGTSVLWRVGNQPAAGATPSAAPGGNAPVDSTTGGFLFTNPSGTDTQHLTTAYTVGSAIGSLLLYDRIFHVAKTMNSTSTEAVTGVPTRYQNQTGGTPDYIGGNFLFVEVGGTALPATAHNWTVCTYNDQGGASSTLPSITGNASAIVDRLDHPLGQWFAPLENGDVGVKALTQMQCSALVATGLINFVIGHPIAWMPVPIAGVICEMDGINTSFNLMRIFDDACLSFLDVMKPATTATTYNGQFEAVAG